MLKEYWAHYNAQIIDQTKIFCNNRIGRFQTQIERFIDITQNNLKNLSQVWENVRQREILGRKDVTVSLGITMKSGTAPKIKGSNPNSKFNSPQTKDSPVDLKEEQINPDDFKVVTEPVKVELEQVKWAETNKNEKKPNIKNKDLFHDSSSEDDDGLTA